MLRRRGDPAARAAAGVPAVAIFGVGHVGLELARILAATTSTSTSSTPAPASSTDERLALPATGRPGVRVHHSPVPELALGAVPAGTHVLVMTHDHAEDFALCDAALRCTHLGSVGLIGSAAKWAASERASPSRVTTTATIDRIRSPDRAARPPGQGPGRDRRLGVAAELMHVFAADHVPRPGGEPRSSTGPAPSTPPTTRSPRRRRSATTTTSGSPSPTTG